MACSGTELLYLSNNRDLSFSTSSTIALDCWVNRQCTVNSLTPSTFIILILNVFRYDEQNNVMKLESTLCFHVHRTMYLNKKECGVQKHISLRELSISCT
jgi:hypothetical protein